MSLAKLIRIDGILCILGGALYALAALIHPAGEDAPSVASALWVPAHVIGGIAAALMLFGLIGLYATQAAGSGPLLLAGFVLAFLGTTLLEMEELQSATVTPSLAARAPGLLQTLSSASGAMAFGVVFLVSFFLGYLLFGIGTWRLNLLPRWSAAALILGLVLSFGGALSHVAGIVAAFVFGGGWAWMGYALWSGSST